MNHMSNLIRQIQRAQAQRLRRTKPQPKPQAALPRPLHPLSFLAKYPKTALALQKTSNPPAAPSKSESCA